MKNVTIKSGSLFVFLLLVLSAGFSQEIDPSKVVGLEVDKRLEITVHKDGNGGSSITKDSVVYGFSFVLSDSKKYYGINELSKYKKTLLDCTIGHDLSHSYVKKAINAKYARKASWFIGVAGVIPFLITFYDGPNFENQTMRWTGATILGIGILTNFYGQKLFRKRIEKACINF